MATWFRHRCRECGQPVKNKALGQWEHLNRAIEHKVEQVDVEKWED